MNTNNAGSCGATSQALDLVAGPLYPGMKHPAMRDLAWHPALGWFVDDHETWSERHRRWVRWSHLRFERALARLESRRRKSEGAERDYQVALEQIWVKRWQLRRWRIPA